MADKNRQIMVVEPEMEIEPVEVIDDRDYYDRDYYDREMVEKRKDKIVDSVHKGIETYKMETAIAKKEADTSAHATKSHIDSEKAFVESLLREKERKDITPQEREDLNNRIEAAEIRMHEAEKEARQQTEESPYRRSINWGRIAIGAVIVGSIGYGGWRLFGKFVA